MQTAVYIAATNANETVLAALLECKANPSATKGPPGGVAPCCFSIIGCHMFVRGVAAPCWLSGPVRNKHQLFHCQCVDASALAGQSALIAAAVTGMRKVVRLLVAAGADLEYNKARRCQVDVTPEADGAPEADEDGGVASTDAASQSGQGVAVATALWYAAREGQIHAVRELIKGLSLDRLWHACCLIHHIQHTLFHHKVFDVSGP